MANGYRQYVRRLLCGCIGILFKIPGILQICRTMANGYRQYVRRLLCGCIDILFKIPGILLICRKVANSFPQYVRRLLWGGSGILFKIPESLPIRRPMANGYKNTFSALGRAAGDFIKIPEIFRLWCGVAGVAKIDWQTAMVTHRGFVEDDGNFADWSKGGKRL